MKRKRKETLVRNRWGATVDQARSEAAQEAANTRANNEDDEDYEGARFSDIRTVSRRISEGFELMGLSGDDDA